MNETIIIGVGGAGCSIAEKLGRSHGYKVLVVNSVGNNLEEKEAQHRLYLNMNSKTGRLPTVITAEKVVEEVSDEFREILHGTQHVILVVGLGGVTGSGSAPALARIARTLGMKITVVATLPFPFEAQRRMIAEAALTKLKDHADTLILHDYSDTSRYGSLQMSLDEFFNRVSDDIIAELSPSHACTQ